MKVAELLQVPIVFLPGRSLAGLITSVAAFFVIFGGILPFVPQYLQIKKSNNAEGFSTFVCFVLLVANILRIWFWFGHPFELPLFFQSIVMIFTMLVMVHICTLVRNRSELIPETKSKSFTESASMSSADESLLEGRRHSAISNSSSAYRVEPKIGPRLTGPQSRFLDFEWSHFWMWTDFESYLQCLGVISLITGVFTYLFLDSAVFIETLGFLAVFFEAMLGAPQFYRNYKNKSTHGMSVLMVLTWTVGDVFKTTYFIIRVAPTQFFVCGALQVGLDMLIMLQVFCYRGRGPIISTKKAAIQ